jgi:predicted  nucleic acid-binding Zn-ribbon protein
MVDPLIEKLLVLQERDIRRDGVRRDLDDIPLRRTALEREVAVAKAAHQETLEKQKTFEMKRRDMERQTADAEAQRFKLRSQQASCRKNDEYAMLDKQIDAATAKIGELETETFSAMSSAPR